MINFGETHTHQEPRSSLNEDKGKEINGVNKDGQGDLAEKGGNQGVHGERGEVQAVRTQVALRPEL